MKKQTTEYYLNETIKSLMEHDPLEIVLFGSMAKGNPDESSDLDILVVLDNDTLSNSYEDRMKMKFLKQGRSFMKRCNNAWLNFATVDLHIAVDADMWAQINDVYIET